MVAERARLKWVFDDLRRGVEEREQAWVLFNLFWTKKPDRRHQENVGKGRGEVMVT